MSNQPIAQTILAQLGGRAFQTMTGARDFINLGNGLSFRLPGNITRNRINAVRITLDPSDTYTVEFIAIRGMKMKTVAEHSDVYCDQLTELFRYVTGLETRMPRVIFG